MGLVIATKGSDFISGAHENIAVDFEGTARLAPLYNLIPDPNMEDFEADGLRHRYWDLYEAPRPTHWGVYVRDNKTVTNFSRQTMAPLPLSQSNYQITDELLRGAGPIDAANAVAIANPDTPRISTFTVGQHIGLPAGFISIAFGWIMGPRHWMRSNYYTPPGARTEPIEIAQGQGVQFMLPQTEIPAGVVGVMVWANYPTATYNGALNAIMYPQIRQPAKTFRTMGRIFGPFSARRPADVNENKTYWGENLAKPRVWNTSSRFGHKRLMQVQLSYTLFTERGTSSASSNVTPHSGNTLAHIAKPGKNRINFRPKVHPVGSVEWQPEVRFYLDGEWSDWYKITKKGGNNSRFRRNESAAVLVADPTKWPEEAPTQLVKLGKKSENDATGIAPPEEGLEVPTLLDLNTSGLTPGNHQVRTSYFVGEEEGRVSTAKKIMVNAGQGLRVRKPLFHNKMPNANASELTTNDPEVPHGWWFYKPYPTGLTCKKIKGGVKVTERRNNNTGVTDVFSTPFGHLLTDQDRYTVRFRVSSDDFSGGSAFAFLDEYDDQEQYLRTTAVARFRGTYNRRIHLRIKRQNADPENINIIAIGNDTALIRLRVDTRATSSTGPANYSYNFTHWGVFEGWGDPREIASDKLSHKRAGNEVIDEHGYPEGGYNVIVEDPDDGPIEYDTNMLHRVYFENGLPARWSQHMQGSSTLGNFVRPSNNLSGQYALRIRKADTTNTSATNYIYSDFPEADKSLAVATDVYLNSYDVTGVDAPQQLFLGGIWETDGKRLAEFFWRRDNGQLLVRTIGDGVSTDVVGTSVELKDIFSIELYVSNAGTSNGRIRAYVGRNRSNRELVVDASGIDWTSRVPRRVCLGVVAPGFNPARAFDVWYDNVVVSLNSTESYARQPGNYIEYYGPARTPRDGRYGPEGLKVPVEANTTYTIGMNVWYRDLELDTALLRFRSMTADGDIDKNHGPVVRNLIGDSQWKRVFKTFTTGPETTHIEFYGNVLGAGLVKMHGISLEEGTVQREYDGRNQRSGFLEVNMRTELPDVLHATDPVHYLSHINGIRNVQVIGTDDEETSYSVMYRYGDSLATLSAPVNDWAEIPRSAQIVQVRVDFATTNEWNSPELEEIQLDLERPVSQLCRGDGTEFKGGVIVRNVGAVLPVRNVENIVMANNRISKITKGSFPIRWLRNLTLEAHRDSTVSQIVRAYGYGDSEFVLEQAGKRYTIVFEELPEFEVKPKSRIKRGNREDFVVHEATGVNAYIVGQENLD